MNRLRNDNPPTLLEDGYLVERVGCGCTIHDDRGTPCLNRADICFGCRVICWGIEPPPTSPPIPVRIAWLGLGLCIGVVVGVVLGAGL